MTNFFSMLLESGTEPAADNCNSGNMYTYVVFGIAIVLIIIMLVVPMFTSRKREKERIESNNSLCVGDKIMTVGGVVGVIVAIHEEGGERIIVIETGEGDNKSTVSFVARALSNIIERGENYNSKIAETSIAQTNQDNSADAQPELKEESSDTDNDNNPEQDTESNS